MSEQRIHRGRHKSNFSALSNRIWEDPKLSVEAKGTLGYLLSRPPNWQVRVTQVGRKLKIGRDKLYRILNELIEAGYVVRRQGRSAGSFKPVSYYIHDVVSSPHTDLPEAAEPDTAEPDTANQDALVKKENSTNTDFNKTTASNKAACPKPAPSRAARAVGLGGEGSSRSERPEVIQARLAKRLGGGDAQLGWLLLGALSDSQRDQLTAQERNGGVSAHDLDRIQQGLLDAQARTLPAAYRAAS